jgi:Fanconi anemia group M protein
MREMKANFQTPLLLVEGFEGIYVRRGVHPNAIRGMLAAIACDFNIPIIPSEDALDSAQIIQTIAKREQVDERRMVSLRGEKKPQKMSERQRFIVESLPHVSAVLADRLLRKFKSVKKLINASQRQMMEVEGIGEGKAQDICSLIRADYLQEDKGNKD